MYTNAFRRYIVCLTTLNTQNYIQHVPESEFLKKFSEHFSGLFNYYSKKSIHLFLKLLTSLVIQ